MNNIILTCMSVTHLGEESRPIAKYIVSYTPKWKLRVNLYYCFRCVGDIVEGMGIDGISNLTVEWIRKE